jgi:hypothetical protein
MMVIAFFMIMNQGLFSVYLVFCNVLLFLFLFFFENILDAFFE